MKYKTIYYISNKYVLFKTKETESWSWYVLDHTFELEQFQSCNKLSQVEVLENRPIETFTSPFWWFMKDLVEYSTKHVKNDPFVNYFKFSIQFELNKWINLLNLAQAPISKPWANSLSKLTLTNIFYVIIKLS